MTTHKEFMASLPEKRRKAIRARAAEILDAQMERCIGTEAELNELQIELQKFHYAVSEVRAIVRSLGKVRFPVTPRRSPR